MSLKKNSKLLNNSIRNNDEKIEKDKNEYKINLVKRTLENNTHEVIEDTKFKNITSWRKSEKKFLCNLIYNILSFGILHLISLFYPNLYLKLYCNPWPPKECDYFLVENIYGEFTLCTKIHKKSKNNKDLNNSDILKNSKSSSKLINLNHNIEHYISRNLTYSFEYKSMIYEYNEETNEIIPVYMNLSKMTNKTILNFFSEGLTNDNLIKKYQERYGKNKYVINLNIAHFYFQKIEKNNFIIFMSVKLLELASGDFITLFVTFGIIIIILLLEFYLTKRIIYDLYKKEYTLDGEEIKLKVKRIHNFENNNYFRDINNCDLLPGDIIYLKSNDYVPCDGLILEGECIANGNSLTGSFDNFKKTSLKNNNEQFNYDLNKNHILYHGMKIVKSYSKLNEGYISVLCINIGGNTYKANLFSNIIYFFERKNEYKEIIKLFGEERKYILYLMITILVSSIIFGIIFVFFFDWPINYSDKQVYILIIISVAKIISKSSMPVYFLTNSLIFISSIWHLKSKNILCFDKSKLAISSKINTIFFNKTGTLCDNNFEVYGFHPPYITSYKSNNIGIKTYKFNQYKEMNTQLFEYYKYYLYKAKNPQEFDPRHALRKENNQLNINKLTQESNEYICLFLECLLSCNNIEKYNTEIFGNPIEKSIFLNCRWDIKPYKFDDFKINDNSISNSDTPYSTQLNNDNDSYYDNTNTNILIDKNINDIYPSNYYKITESIKNENRDKINRSNIIRISSKFSLEQEKKNTNNQNANISTDSSLSININNFIKYNISRTSVKTYKLRIYKRFINDGTLNSSAIVYNFIKKELRFMTKGMPEDLLDKIDIRTLPGNLNSIISQYRKMGLIIVICASKLISIDDYKDSSPIDEYMNDLTFCGFITLKNKLKNDIINSIKELKEFDCNLIITSGDNLYNTISAGFDSGIIQNKNIISFDKDINNNKIIISKIYNVKNFEEEDLDAKSNYTNLDKYSKQTSNYSNSFSKKKEKLSSNNNSYKDSNNKIIDKESDNRELINENNKENQYNGSIRKRGKIKNTFKLSKKLFYFNKKDGNLISPNSPHQNIDSSTKNLDSSTKNNKSNSRINIISPLKSPMRFNNSSIKKNRNKSLIDDKNNRSFFEKFYYYPKIFEDHKDLIENCIYCISGKAFKFLYRNKEKKHCKYILEKIHKFCKIFYNMSSLDKSLAIDFYREHPEDCICSIGKCYSDLDSLFSSNIGISLRKPKNVNTILSHFYSENSEIISIKKIILEGRAVKENILLLKISCFFYSMVLNSYIICCFIRQEHIINLQLDYLELSFLLMSISAFTVKYDNFQSSSSPLIQNKKLYNLHYITQIAGILFLKIGVIYGQCRYFIGNTLLDNKTVDKIFCSYYFIFCIEQLLSIIFLFNLITFYRKNAFTNVFFVFYSLCQLIYLIILLTLNSSNFKFDLFKITNFEFLENLIDSFDDRNRMTCAGILAIDFFSSLLFSRITYLIFDRIAKNQNKKNNP